MAKGITRKIQENIAALIDRTTHLDVAKATETIAKTFGLNERLIKYTHIELRNRLNESRYKSTPFEKRILFLPHCLRSSNGCKGKYNDEGLQCEKCGKCQLAELTKLAEENNYKGWYITPGGSMVHKLIEKYKPGAVLGVCCFEEARMAFDKLYGSRIAPQAILLLRDGCKDTAVNVDEVKEKLLLTDKNLVEGKK